MTQQNSMIEAATDIPAGGQGPTAPGATAAIIAPVLGQSWLVAVMILTRLAVHGTNEQRRLVDELMPYTMLLFFVSIVANCFPWVLGKDAFRAARMAPTVTRRPGHGPRDGGDTGDDGQAPLRPDVRLTAAVPGPQGHRPRPQAGPAAILPRPV